MTVDVEDYFHVSVFDGVVPRARWDVDGEPRRARTPSGCSTCSTSTACAARSSCSAGWPSATRRWCGRSPRAATRWRRTATRTGWSTTRRPTAFRDDVRRAKALLEDAGGRGACSGYRAPSFSVTDAVAVGARRAARRRLPLRREHLSDPSRSLRHPGRAALAARDRRARGGASVRGAGVDGAARRHQPAGRRRRLLPHPAVRVDAVGHRAAEPGRSGSRRSSTCIRGRSIPTSRACRASALGRFRHYRNLHQTERAAAGAAARLPLRPARRASSPAARHERAQAEQARAATGPAVGRARRDRAARRICDRYVHAHPAATGYHLTRLAAASSSARSATRRGIWPPKSDGRRRRRAAAGLLPQPAVRPLRGVDAVSQLRRRAGRRRRRASGRSSTRAIDETARARRLASRAAAHARSCSRTSRQAAQGGDERCALAADAERQWDALDRKVRNQVRKGEKSELDGRARRRRAARRRSTTCSRATCATSARRSTRRAFFGEVLRTFPDTARVFVVRHDGRPVAASIVHWHRATIEVPWASALREFNPLCANVLLYWHMLQFAVERGFARVRLRPLDAGRGHVPLQEAVGRRAARAGLGVLDRAQARRCPTSARRTRSSTSPSGPGSGCRCRSPPRSDRTSSGTSRDRC